MTRRLVLAMTLLAALVAVALAVPMALVVANDQRAAFVSQLEVDTLATAATMSAQIPVDWQSTAEETASRTGARVVVVDPDRTLAADSSNSTLDRSFDRPEITAALAGSLTSDVRMSETMGEPLRYVAAPIVQGYDISGAVRLSLPESLVDEEVRETQRWLAVFVISVVVVAALVAWILARSIAAPLRQVALVAEDLPNDLDQRARTDVGPREVRAVAVALNSTAERLSGILRRTQRVAADASHHLRTPLTGVRLRLEAIEDLTSQAQVATEARAATEEIDRLTRRIEQVLDLARTDVGAMPLEPQDAAEIIRQRIEVASPVFTEGGVTLRAEAPSAAIVTAPRGGVARIIDELLGNALVYARKRVDVTVRSESSFVVVDVIDDGPGIPTDERAAVFERFHRGRESLPGGTGLGLALVQETVSAAGGSVEAREAAGGGTCMRVRLPGASHAR